MNKEDWEEYFELINKRKPSQEEEEKALENGEYFLDIGQELIDSGDGKLGDKTKLEDTEKLEENMIESLLHVEYDQDEADQVKFWPWLVSSLKKPVEEYKSVKGASWYGWAVLGILSLIAGLVNGLLGANISHGVSGEIEEYAYMYGTSDYTAATTSNDFSVSSMLITCLVVFLMSLALVFSGWVARRGILVDKDFTFKKAIDSYGRLFVPVCLILSLTLIFSLFKISSLAFIFLFLALAFTSFISSFAIIHSKNNNGVLDDFYAAILAVMVNGLMLGLAAILVFVPSVMLALQNIFG